MTSTSSSSGTQSSRFFERLADWEIRHPRTVIVFLVVLSAVAVGLLTRLEFDFRPEALQQFSAEEQAYADEISERFGLRDNILLVLLQGSKPGSILDARGLSLLHQVSETVAATEFADQVLALPKLPRKDTAARLQGFALGRVPPLVESLPLDDATVTRAQDYVAGSRLIPGQMVSRDGSTGVVIVVLHPRYADHTVLDKPLAALVESLDRLLTEEAQTLSAADVTYQTQLAGLPFVRVQTVRNLKSEQRGFWPLTAALYLTLLWFIYRHLALTILPLLAVGLASLWGLAMLPATGTQVNVVNNIVPSLILVIGVCNAVHMLHGFRSARQAGLDAPDAARAMMAELGLPAFLTSLTTAIGFVSLMVARNPTLQQLGWQAGAGVMLSYLALVTLLPVAASRIDDEKVTQPGRGMGEVSWMGGLVRGLNRRPRTVLFVALLALALSVAIGRTVPVDAHVLDTFPPGHPIYESNRLVERELGGILPLEVELAGAPGQFDDPEALAQVFEIQQDLVAMESVITSTSVVDLLAEVEGVVEDVDVPAFLADPGRVRLALDTMERYSPGALGQYRTEDGSHLRLATRLKADGIQASLRTLEQIEALKPGWLEPLGEGVTLRMTGNAFISARGLDFFIRDLFFSLATASLVIFFVLVVVFRSLRIGLISVLPNVLPLVLTLATMPLWGYQLNTGTAIVFTITIGMAVDNTIHLLTRYRDLRLEGVGQGEAIATTFRHTGAAVVASNLMLIGGFSILFTSDFEPVFRVAALTTTTIAAAMLAALLVLPGLLLLFGKPIGGAD